MDRTFGTALVVLVALTIVCVFLIASPTTFDPAPGDAEALRAMGTTLFTGGLAAFLMGAFRWDRDRRPSHRGRRTSRSETA